MWIAFTREWASSATRFIAIKFNLKTITDRGNLLEKLHEALVTINGSCK
jgi:hypothetical protein